MRLLDSGWEWTQRDNGCWQPRVGIIEEYESTGRDGCIHGLIAINWPDGGEGADAFVATDSENGTLFYPTAPEDDWGMVGDAGTVSLTKVEFLAWCRENITGE